MITAVGAAWLDMMFSPKMSHAGAAMTAAKTSGVGHLIDIVWRKVLMNFEIALRPPTLVAFFAVALLIWLGRRVFVVRLPWQSGIRYLSLAACPFYKLDPASDLPPVSLRVCLITSVILTGTLCSIF